MKLMLFVFLSMVSMSSYADGDIIQTILNSKWHGCDKAREVFNQLEGKQIYDLSHPYGASYYEVYGTLPEGSQAIVYLTMTYNCDYGSFGGGGCSNKFQCRVKVH